METKGYWADFWNKYRVRKASTEEDLYFQVGKTVDKKPISKEAFQAMIDDIQKKLMLNEHDTLIDLCCGNGLITYELAPKVKEIFAVDFAQHLIETAIQLRSKPNITYLQNDAMVTLRNTLSKSQAKSIKILMHDALAYFTNDDLSTMLTTIKEFCSGKHVMFFITGIPDDERKWNFYNTPERKEQYLNSTDKVANNGMGRWWSRSEIGTICSHFNVSFSIEDQPQLLSNYRMNLLVESKT